MFDNEDIKQTPSQDERVLAALAHACCIFPTIGMVGAIVIWATQKEKSDFTAFQALQAVVYHLVMIVVGFLSGICYMCAFLTFPLIMIIVGIGSESAFKISPFVFMPMGMPFLMMGLMFLFWFLFIVYGFFGALMTLQGKDFRYVIIGNKLEKYLKAEIK